MPGSAAVPAAARLAWHKRQGIRRKSERVGLAKHFAGETPALPGMTGSTHECCFESLLASNDQRNLSDRTLALPTGEIMYVSGCSVSLLVAATYGE